MVDREYQSVSQAEDAVESTQTDAVNIELTDCAPLEEIKDEGGNEVAGGPSAVPPPEYSETDAIVMGDVTNAKLPTYEEYEKEHENEDEFDTNLPEEFTMADSSGTNTLASQIYQGVEMPLGDDFTLYCTMFLAFFLNWIGFLLAYFFSQSIAGKCGATAGFGLGLIKMAFILGRSSHDDDDGMQDSSGWFVWILVFFGWFIFVRGITLYLRVKGEYVARQGDNSNV